MILLIDNYDSFVFNLARYVSELGFTPMVKRHDQMTLQEIEKLNPEKIIISPGPCTPQQAGISLDVIRHFGSRIPILGVCLGHQAIGEAFGGIVTRARFPMHGKASKILHNGKGLFKGLDDSLQAARYHSLIVSEQDFPDSLKITARSEEGEVMALQHKTHPIFGVQFHPESVLTVQGHMLLKNFLFIC